MRTPPSVASRLSCKVLPPNRSQIKIIYYSVTNASWGERSEVIRGIMLGEQRFCVYLHMFRSLKGITGCCPLPS